MDINVYGIATSGGKIKDFLYTSFHAPIRKHHESVGALHFLK